VSLNGQSIVYRSWPEGTARMYVWDCWNGIDSSCYVALSSVAYRIDFAITWSMLMSESLPLSDSFGVRHLLLTCRCIRAARACAFTQYGRHLVRNVRNLSPTITSLVPRLRIDTSSTDQYIAESKQSRAKQHPFHLNKHLVPVPRTKSEFCSHQSLPFSGVTERDVV
jgi:hypothetical protein